MNECWNCEYDRKKLPTQRICTHPDGRKIRPVNNQKYGCDYFKERLYPNDERIEGLEQKLQIFPKDKRNKNNKYQNKFCWHIRFKSPLEKNSISDKTVYVKHEMNGMQTRFNCVPSFNEVNNTILVSAIEPYEEDVEYFVFISKDIKKKNGTQLMTDYIVIKFIIHNSEITSYLMGQEGAKSQNPNIQYVIRDIVSTEAPSVKKILKFVKEHKRWLFPVITLFTGFISGFIVAKATTRCPNDLVNTRIAKKALTRGYSQDVQPGNILVENDDIKLDIKDVTEIHYSTDAEFAALTLWDYAAEDGDTFQIFVDSEAFTDEIVLYNKPIEVVVPVDGIIEVRGIYDGGGGITYAVHCDLNQTTYLNESPLGGSNMYTFTLDSERNFIERLLDLP